MVVVVVVRIVPGTWDLLICLRWQMHGKVGEHRKWDTVITTRTAASTTTVPTASPSLEVPPPPSLEAISPSSLKRQNARFELIKQRLEKANERPPSPRLRRRQEGEGSSLSSSARPATSRAAIPGGETDGLRNCLNKLEQIRGESNGH